MLHDAVLAVHVSAVGHDEDPLALELLSRQVVAIAEPERLPVFSFIHKSAKLVLRRIERLETAIDPLDNLLMISLPFGEVLVEHDRLLAGLMAVDYNADSHDERQENDRDAEEQEEAHVVVGYRMVSCALVVLRSEHHEAADADDGHVHEADPEAAHGKEVCQDTIHTHGEYGDHTWRHDPERERPVEDAQPLQDWDAAVDVAAQGSEVDSR